MHGGKFENETIQPSQYHESHWCLHGSGPAPYIVMPFMANGSLLSYLRKERSKLLLDETADEDLVRVIWKKKTGNTNDVEQLKAAHATQF